MATLDLATGEKRWLEVRAQSLRHMVPVKAVGVRETALGERQKTGQGWKIESEISGSWK